VLEEDELEGNVLDFNQDDSDELECNLAAILSEDDHMDQEDLSDHNEHVENNENIKLFERTLLQPIEEEDLPESSLPVSPCKPSSHRRQLLSIINGIQDNKNSEYSSEKSDCKRKIDFSSEKTHWSLRQMEGDTENIIPIPKIRRTASESIPTPLSIVS